MIRAIYKAVSHKIRANAVTQAFRKESNMPRLAVRCIAGEERMQLKFSLTLPSGKERQFNMDRSQQESLQDTLARMEANVAKHVNKKKKKKKKDAAAEEEPEAPIPITLRDGSDGAVDLSTPNLAAWEEGGTLQIADTEYDIRVNQPTITRLVVSDSIMAGYVTYPDVLAEFTDIDRSAFTWLRLVKEPLETMETDAAGESEDVTHARKKPRSASPARAEEESWIVAHEGVHFIPSLDDVGCQIKLRCTPADGERQGEPMEVVSASEVQPGPGLCPFENRHKFTENQSAHGSFRMMTYNILADLYADSDYSRDFLFPYCPEYALKIDYRKQLLIKEIRGYKADVICLQEVDMKVFLNDLLPVMEVEGFSGLMKRKDGQVPEGTATFYRKSKFKLIKREDIQLRESIDNDPLFNDVKGKVESSESLKTKMSARTTSLQVSILESIECPGKKILVATTHLYFHPKCPHVRLLQVITSFRHIERILKQFEGDDISVIYCGDLNATTSVGVHEFITRKNIGEKHADWYSGGKEEFVEKMNFHHNLDLLSACGYPDYTNFVTSFSGCLDYIYVDHNKLTTGAIVPMPTHEEVTMATALPNPFFPSDHIALICDLSWKEKSNQTASN